MLVNELHKLHNFVVAQKSSKDFSLVTFQCRSVSIEATSEISFIETGDEWRDQSELSSENRGKLFSTWCRCKCNCQHDMLCDRLRHLFIDNEHIDSVICHSNVMYENIAVYLITSGNTNHFQSSTVLSARYWQ